MAGLVVGACAVFGALAVLRHEAFLSDRYDLGNYVQAIWSAAHGHLLQATTGTGLEQSRLGSHFEPILFLLVPLWVAWSNPDVLLLVQAACVVSGAVPVYLLAVKHLRSTDWGLFWAGMYLLYTPVEWVMLDDFHAVAFAIPLLLLCVWYLDTDQLGKFAIAALLVVATKEEIGLTVACLGLWYAVAHRRTKEGLAIFAGAAAWSVIAVSIVVPLFAAGASNPFVSRYDALGNSPGAIAGTIFTNPVAVLGQFAHLRDAAYVLLLLAPFAGFLIRAPLLAACAAPEFALNLLSSFQSQTSIAYHYVAGIVPFVVAASVIGAGRIERESPSTARRRAAVTAGVLAVITLALGPVTVLTPRIVRSFDNGTAASARAAVAVIPADAPLSASQNLGAHLSTRERIYDFPMRRDAEWIAVGVDEDWIAPHREGKDAIICRLYRDRRLALRLARHGILVFGPRSAAVSGGNAAANGPGCPAGPVSR